jgi:hypothetical protein
MFCRPNFPLSSLLLFLTLIVVPADFVAAREDSRVSRVVPATNSNAGIAWNLVDTNEPLLELPANSRQDLDLGLTFPFGQFGIPLSQSLHYNSQSRRYLLMLLSENGRRGNYLELRQVGRSNVYATGRGPKVELLDQGSIKVLRAFNGNQYSFMSTAEGDLRCVHIQDRTGASIRVNYNSEGMINRLADNSGRTISVNYANNHVAGLVQTWNVSSVKMVKSWNPSSNIHETRSFETSLEKAPRFGLAKSIPTNALNPYYTAEMARCDQMLARIFGGKGAIAAANSYEPAGLSRQYPIYRGDLRGSDGLLRPGHLSYAMHLYGNEDGTGVTPIYVPAGFTSHTTTPTPTDAAITFYYPRLGNLTNVTLAVFHVADFAIQDENGRIRIGNIGGRGGSFELYKHSHIEFYRGNTGLPASTRRQSLRINPAVVFGAGYDSVRERTVAQRQ